MTVEGKIARARPGSIAPTAYERGLGIVALALLAVVGVALWRGRTDLGAIPWPIAFHLVTVVLALVLTPVMLWRRRGDRWHRRLGYVWVTAMMVTALDSFAVRALYPGHLSWIHLLSLFTLVMVPRMVISARRHDIAGHRRAVLGLVTGALVIAGAFTLLPMRLLGHWLFGG